MPGPNSAPNGARPLVTDARKREQLRHQGALRTGKTPLRRKAQP